MGYPYATPGTYNGLNAAEGDVTVKRYEVALLAIQETEKIARIGLAALTELIKQNRVPGSLIIYYNATAIRLNNLFDQVAALRLTAGGGETGPIGYLPVLEVSRDFVSTDFLAASELSVKPGTGGTPPLGGFWPILGVIALAGGTIILTTYLITRSVDHKSEVRMIEAESAKAQVLGEAYQKLGSGYVELVNACHARGDTDCETKIADSFAKIEQGVAQGMNAAMQSRTRPKDPRGIGFFGWVGIAVVFGAVGVIGWTLWKKRQKREVTREVVKERLKEWSPYESEDFFDSDYSDIQPHRRWN